MRCLRENDRELRPGESSTVTTHLCIAGHWQDVWRSLTVREAMIRNPKTLSDSINVREAITAFEDDHVHALLLTDAAQRLTAVLHRDDLSDARSVHPAAALGQLMGRWVMPDADLEATRHHMITRRVRRLAVMDSDRRLLGLLCLKQSHRGFCTEADLASRAAECAGLVLRS